MRPLTRVWMCAAATLVGLTVAIARGDEAAQTPAPAQQPVFRGETTIVPLNVTVLDRDRKPITDLTASDFRIFEDNVPQKLSVFATQVLAPEPPDARAPAPAAAGGIQPQHRRVFLIVLGYGRLQEPTKAVDATLKFVRERLLPQDLVSVLLFDRATDLTTDHAYVGHVVDNYRKAHESIVGAIDTFVCAQHTCLMPPIPLDEPPDLPAAIQSRIDALFDETPSAAAAPADHAAAPPRPRLHNVRDMLFGTEEFRKTAGASYPVSWNLLVTLTDRLKEYGGIEYLRQLDEEKRMVVIVPRGLGLASVQDDERFAARANAARITVDLIHTGGLAGAFVQSIGTSSPRGPAALPRPDAIPPMRGGGCAGARCDMIPPASAVTASQFFMGAASSERVAELTGGEFLGNVFADKVFADIDATSRFEYVLGYTPSRPFVDAAYRQIVVKVDRPGAIVVYRHGYQPGNDLAPIDVRALVARTQVEGAVALDRPMTDIGVTLKAVAPPAGVHGDVIVDLRIDAARLSFTPAAGGFTGSLLIQVFCGDAKQNIVGSVKERMDPHLTAAARDRVLADGLTYSTRVPVTAPAAPVTYVKAVVYDFGSDLLGSATVTLKR